MFFLQLSHNTNSLVQTSSSNKPAELDEQHAPGSTEAFCDQGYMIHFNFTHDLSYFFHIKTFWPV